MVRTSFFLCVLTTLTTFFVHSEEYVNIEIDPNTRCVLTEKNRKSLIFNCDEDDLDINAKFNSTHSWFIENNRKCIATIENIKKNAFCGDLFLINHHNVGFGAINVVNTASKYGNNQQTGEPLKSEDLFHSPYANNKN